MLQGLQGLQGLHVAENIHKIIDYVSIRQIMNYFFSMYLYVSIGIL